MNENNNNNELWVRDSINAWGYSRGSQYESWEIIAHKLGTAGNMDTYCLGREYHNLMTDDWEVEVNLNCIFTGINAREEIYEFVGL